MDLRAMRQSANGSGMMTLCKFPDTAARAHEHSEDLSQRGRETGPTARRKRPEPSILSELAEVLAPHPGGLRRWSVMRAIRDNRHRASREVSLKFEAEVERAFRSSCSNWGDVKCQNPETALFYRPPGKAGEVWAMHATHAKAWRTDGDAAMSLNER
jgi:hypothetical protein